jgi:hypothetical protein
MAKYHVRPSAQYRYEPYDPVEGARTVSLNSAAADPEKVPWPRTTRRPSAY